LETIGMGLIGAGRWGRNYLRVLTALEEVELRWCCDTDPDRAALVGRLYPRVRYTRSSEEVLKDADVMAVVIATPPATHYPLAKEALSASKHVLVEKPFALSYSQAKELVDMARARGLVLMAGHIMEYHPVVNWVRGYIAAGELGKPRYLHFRRTNYGRSLAGVSVLWDLVVHDLSILRFLLDVEPLMIRAEGVSFLDRGVHDVVGLTLWLPENTLAQVDAMWLHPVGAQTMTVIGEKRTLVFDDLRAGDKLRIYDRGLLGKLRGHRPPAYRGDVWIPYIEPREPLQNQCEHFLRCVRRGEEPITGARDILWVMQVAEAAQRSLDLAGPH